jgi:hypothetical protein
MSLLIDSTRKERQVKKSEGRRDRELSDIRFLLRFSEFRRFYKRLIDSTLVFKGLLNDRDIGRRDFGVILFNDLNEANPDSYKQMREEQESEMISEKITEEKQIQKENEGRLT